MKIVQNKNRIIAAVMSFLMVFAMLPANIVFADDTISKYIFNHDGETAEEVISELSSCFNLVNNYGKIGALQFKNKTGSVTIPDIGINSGVAVFDIEFCPAGKTVQTAVLKNSKDEVLFAVSYVYPSSGTKGLYITDKAGGTNIVKLQEAKSNMWSRVRVEIDLETSKKSGVLQYKITSAYYNKASNYETDYSKWTANEDVAQDSMVSAGYTNGTVTTAIDGTADHPFDLNSITISSTTNARWLGDISLYNANALSVKTAPVTQEVGKEFNPNGAELEIKYSTGATETVVLSDLTYGTDYTVTGFDSTSAVEAQTISINYMGFKADTTVNIRTLTPIDIKLSDTKKTTYYVGDVFETGLTGNVIYTDGVTNDILGADIEVTTDSADTSKMIVTGFDTTASVEKQTLTVSCLGVSTTYDIEVKAVELEKISVTSKPAKTEYALGEALDVTGLEITATYNNGKTEVFTSDKYTVGEFDSTKTGARKVTVTANNTDITTDFIVIIPLIPTTEQTMDLFKYTEDAEEGKTAADIGVTGDKAQLVTVEAGIAGNTTQMLGVSAETGAESIIDTPITDGIVKISSIFNENSLNAYYRVKDKDGNVLINFGQFPSKGNLNLYEGQSASGTPSTIATQKNKWIKLDTEIDLDKSKETGIFQFITKVYYKEGYTDEYWTYANTVTSLNYINDFDNANGCSTDGLSEFSIGSVVFGGSAETVYFDDIQISTTNIPVLAAVEIKTAPAKAEYAIGEELNLEGLTITETYAGDITKDISDIDYIKANYDITGFDSTAAGDKEITVAYKENAEIKANFTVNVKAATLKSIAVTTQPTKTEYFAGDKIDVSGMVVTATYTDESTKELSESDYEVLADLSTAGDNVTVTVTAAAKDKDGNEVTATFNVKVKALEIVGIEIATAPAKTVYVVGDKLDTTARTLKSVYNNGKKVDLSIDDCEITGFNSEAPAEAQTITIKYGEFTATYTIKITEKASNQSFYYIDQETAEEIGFVGSKDGVLSVVTDNKGGNDTNKIAVKNGVVSKTFTTPITTGKITFETITYHNSAVFATRLVDSKGNGLINYSQQSSGNLNLYEGVATTGSVKYMNLASKDIVKNKWVKTVTEIDLDASNEKGVLQFVMTVYYKGAYTDEEWKEVQQFTQDSTYLTSSFSGFTSGAATAGLTSFDIGGIAYETTSTAYADDIMFDDGNGISGIVTLKSKELKGIEITKPATVTEFQQGAKLNTAGLEITGKYLYTYSDESTKEVEKVIATYDTAYDFSQVTDKATVTITVKDGENVFTVTYDVKVVEKSDSSYITFEYVDEESAGIIGFDGSKISVTSGEISADDTSNESNKLTLEKGTSTATLAEAVTTGTVHFETAFLTTATSKASLFLRILNSEGLPMVDIGQYGSSNCNLYIDRKTSGTDGAMAGQFGGFKVKKWAKAEVDIDLNKSKEAGHLVFNAVIYTTDDYSSGNWSKFASFNQDLYLNSTMAPTSTGAASSTATVFDVAAIELYNAGSSKIYFDDMFFEAIQDGATKTLTNLEITSPATKKQYYVGDKFNSSGLVLTGEYTYVLANGKTFTKTQVITQYDVSFANQEVSSEAEVVISVGGKSVRFTVEVLENKALEGIEEYLVKYINNELVTLEEDNRIRLNKRNILLPSENESGAELSWETVSSCASIKENVLTVEPSISEELAVELAVILHTTNNSGDDVEIQKTIYITVPRASSKEAPSTDLKTDEELRKAVEYMIQIGLFDGQGELNTVDAVLAELERGIKTEEMTAILVNLFDIDTTYTDTVISRNDIDYNAWYTAYVVAAFQLSLETQASREGKENYGIGQSLTQDDIIYMLSRIVAIDQTTLPSDYIEQLFK